MTKKVLFVCLGNICRSPMAEGAFQQLLHTRRLAEQYTCDSAGTAAYHGGDLPDARMRSTAEKHGIVLTHRARQVKAEDFEQFDYILAMDRLNLRHLHTMKTRAGGGRAQLMLFREFDPLKSEGHNDDVPDPYYGSQDDFEEVFEMVSRCAKHLLDYLQTAPEA